MSTTAFLWVLLAIVTAGSIGGLTVAKRRFRAKYDQPDERRRQRERAAAG